MNIHYVCLFAMVLCCACFALVCLLLLLPSIRLYILPCYTHTNIMNDIYMHPLAVFIHPFIPFHLGKGCRGRRRLCVACLRALSAHCMLLTTHAKRKKNLIHLETPAISTRAAKREAIHTFWYIYIQCVLIRFHTPKVN